MRKHAGVVAFTVLLFPGLVTTGFAAGGGMKEQRMKEQQQMKGQATKSVRGEVLKIEDDLYVVKDEQGKEVRLQVDESSRISGDVEEGTRIEARVSGDGRALSIQPAEMDSPQSQQPAGQQRRMR